MKQADIDFLKNAVEAKDFDEIVCKLLLKALLRLEFLEDTIE